ncbi:hypothetical protein PGTUg99_050158 [Puccinia graminis f. sp. tritici]|uniref:Uncharacterized protein n=1 Tax=Puccinia graminis f. sp. tritici TaxID=56615 RepID=A0A5B0S7J0_PUCGR|nr:hypothetical protein PGTUg99_050158 [Puccinia graminis f. sp. tritici]
MWKMLNMYFYKFFFHSMHKTLFILLSWPCILPLVSQISHASTVFFFSSGLRRAFPTFIACGSNTDIVRNEVMSS